MLFKENIDALNTIRFINSTQKSVFLTGKAGTGKTTLLRYIVENTHKETIIAAPTGIAAINAGGVTLHSLFQLPFGSFIPADQLSVTNSSIQIHSRSQLLSKLQMNATKRNMLRKVELLVIDEVSMLRSDLLDAIDTILRHVRRRKNSPFGGVQVLFIGDMLQLPPVVKDSELPVLKQYYKSFFFFDAHVFQDYKPITIELSKIYRQTDFEFIAILNELRHNKLSEQGLSTLNKHYYPGFQQSKTNSHIFITTHNRKADEINSRELKNIISKSYYYDATIKDDFPEHMYPIEFSTQLKVGAQIMFLKNDYSGEQSYYNGKIGFIDTLSSDGIKVAFKDGSKSVWAEKYTWENKRFTLNKETNEIEEKVIGTFTHYPIKLAWAVTVHKSQGLTFKHAIIDVSQAFAPGQIYVALSRLESIEGLVLSQPINFAGPNQSDRLLEFTNKKLATHELEIEYEQAAHAYMYESIFEAFDFSNMIWGLKNHISSYDKDAKRSAKQKYLERIKTIQTAVNPLTEIANNFQKQLQSIVNTSPIDHKKLEERVLAAQKYYAPLFQNISQSIFDLISELESKVGVKAYITELHDLELLFFNQSQKIDKALILITSILKDRDISKELMQEQNSFKIRKIQRSTLQSPKQKKKQTKDKEIKKPTREITYELLMKGIPPAEIAKERGITVNTVENHLTYYVAEGLLDARDFVDEAKLVEIINTSIKLKSKSLKTLKDKLGEAYSYTDLRFAMATMENN